MEGRPLSSGRAERLRALADRMLRAVGLRLYHGPLGSRRIHVGPVSGRYRAGPLPVDAARDLRWDNEYLGALTARYAAAEGDLARASVWTERHRRDGINLPYFRGDNAYLWQLRLVGRRPRHKYLVYAEYLRALDNRRLLTRLHEDGAFGCWVFRTHDGHLVSRDLLDSVNELLFLDRVWSLFERTDFTVFDVGAGYGRLAVAMARTVPGLRRYYCLDAVPESTFVCDFYLGFRGVRDRAVSVPLDRLPDHLSGVRADLAVAVHSFSEMPYPAIEAWLELLHDCGVRDLFVVSNEGARLCSTEADRRRIDAVPLLRRFGYRLHVAEDLLLDRTVRRKVGIHTVFQLYERAGQR